MLIIVTSLIISMYNPQKIKDLLKERGLRGKDLLQYLDCGANGSISQVIARGIRVDRLEKIADFFGVPIDTFFDRADDASRYSVNGGFQVNGNGHNLQNVSVGDLGKTKMLEALLAEKDKRISVLEEMVALLREGVHQQKTQTDSGQ